MSTQPTPLLDLLEQINSGRADEALPELERLHRNDPSHLAVQTLRAEALRFTGRHSEAIDAYRKAGEGGAGARNWLAAGILLAAERATQESLRCLERALAEAPDNQEVLDALITTLFNGGLQKDGIGYARRQLEVGSNPTFLSRAALLIQSNDLYDEATAAFKRIVALAPDDPAITGSALVPARFTCEWEWIESLQRTISGCYDRGDFEAPREFPLTHLTWCTDEARNLGVTRAYVARMIPRATACTPEPLPAAGRRIRVGYLSCDFRNHATMHLMAGVFEHHDRQQFEVFAYDYSSPEDSTYRQRFEAAVEHRVPIHSMSDPQAAHRIAQDRLDILFDLKLYTGGGRSGIMAYRPAPLQVAYIGFPGSAASPDIDYIISDRFVTPDSSAPFYTEKFCRLPHSYQCNDRKRPVVEGRGSRADHGLPEDRVVFGAFNQSYKIDRGSFAVWMRILHAVPDSVLWLLGQSDSARANLSRYAQQAGIDPSRLIYAPFADPQVHLARLRLADAVLDALVCNGHTTTSDALWAGVPVITARGRHFASRVSESLLNAMDLPELVGSDAEGMVRIAQRIGTDPDYRRELRSRVASHRLSRPLFDTARFTRDFEVAIDLLVQRSRAGIAPDHIDVPDLGPVEPARTAPAEPVPDSTASAAGSVTPTAAAATAAANTGLLSRIHIGIINLAHRTDRRLECMQELARIGARTDGRAFFDAKSVPGHGALGCALSHAMALSDFLFTSDQPFALIMEDDFTIRDPQVLLSTLDRICSLDQHWDVFMLGHNTAVPIEGSAFEDVYRTVNAQTASGYLVGRSYAPRLIEYFFRSAELLRRYQNLPDPNRTIVRSLFSCDILWKELQIRDRFLIPIPSLIIQRPSYSDIEKRNVDYGV